MGELSRAARQQRGHRRRGGEERRRHGRGPSLGVPPLPLSLSPHAHTRPHTSHTCGDATSAVFAQSRPRLVRATPGVHPHPRYAPSRSQATHMHARRPTTLCQPDCWAIHPFNPAPFVTVLHGGVLSVSVIVFWFHTAW